MKKFSILIAVVAMMAMTACNEKPAETNDGTDNATATEQVDTAKQAVPKTNVQQAAPTEDGKDHEVAQFSTKDYQVKLENLADGTYRLTLGGKENKVVETKQCVMQKDNYLMKAVDGKVYVINTTAGKEELTIMDKKDIIYHGENGK
ncbi:MAG: hypothetical protein IJV05_01975 [Muribaculaceae bacterium]|nr:hypothetical protein [Muribaculaceae bacterium]